MTAMTAPNRISAFEPIVPDDELSLAHELGKIQNEEELDRFIPLLLPAVAAAVPMLTKLAGPLLKSLAGSLFAQGPRPKPHPGSQEEQFLGSIVGRIVGGETEEEIPRVGRRLRRAQRFVRLARRASRRAATEIVRLFQSGHRPTEDDVHRIIVGTMIAASRGLGRRRTEAPAADDPAELPTAQGETLLEMMTAPAPPQSWVLPADVRAAGEAQLIHYDSPPVWANGRNCSPIFSAGARDLRAHILATFRGVTDIGGLSCRQNTANPSETSVHGVGRALDIMITPIGTRADSAVGDPIANWLVRNAQAIGIQFLIWNKVKWDGGASGRKDGRYGGPHPHTDHIHAELTLAGSRRETPWFRARQPASATPAATSSRVLPAPPWGQWRGASTPASYPRAGAPAPVDERAMVDGLVARGTGRGKPEPLANIIFYKRHPELAGRAIPAGNAALAAEWTRIRDEVVRPSLLGILSEKYESGNGGPGTVSGGEGDRGGASYGTYQLASMVGVDGTSQPPLLSTAATYVKQSAYAAEFAGLTPGTAAFSARWRAIAAREPDAFWFSQWQFIKASHHDPLVHNAKQLNLDAAARSRTLRQVMWSTAVQHGPHGGYSRVLRPALAGKNVLAIDDAGVIRAIYSERGRTNADGTLAHFSKASAKWMQMLRDRFKNELSDALAMLDAEHR